MPRITASGSSNPKDLDNFRADFDRLARRRLVALAFSAVAVLFTTGILP